ncbi:hypothetical protein [Nakamurella sp.]|uniref:hypothetical protein n=1 Tax=Nakamurella sp. TaxID=1869182 RepID=UPI003B3ACA1C
MGQVLLRRVQPPCDLQGGVAGLGRVADGRRGIGAGVAPDTARVVFGEQPVLELAQELRQAADEQREVADQPVKLRGSGEGVGVAGAVVQVADGLRGPGRPGPGRSVQWSSSTQIISGHRRHR